MNKVTLIGRLTRDVELKYTQSGKSIARFTLAINRGYKKELVDFIPVISWDKLGEHCANFISKGKLVAVAGRLQIRSFLRDDGTKGYISEVVAEEVKFLDYSSSADSSASNTSFNLDEFSALEDEDNPFL